MKKLSATYRKTLDFLAENGPATVSEIERKRKLTFSAAHHQMRTLQKRGSVREAGNARTHFEQGPQVAMTWAITSAGIELLGQHFEPKKP